MPAIRDTAQRRAISEVFERADRPLTIEEILRQARRSKPSLGIATVYRTISQLVADHTVVPIQVPEQPVRFSGVARGGIAAAPRLGTESEAILADPEKAWREK